MLRFRTAIRKSTQKPLRRNIMTGITLTIMLHQQSILNFYHRKDSLSTFKIIRFPDMNSNILCCPFCFNVTFKKLY